MTTPREPAHDVPVRDAATVVLLRDGTDGLETWLLTRVSQMVFAAGMSVFPGGRVDDEDAGLPIAGGVAALARRLDCDETLARALVGAAVRETFEETGVLLTVPPADASAQEVRAAVEDGDETFAVVLADRGLAVDASAVAPWSRWVTPVGEPRRYDTRFFVAAVPPGLTPRDVTTESSTADWVPVAEALAQQQRGERRLLPPTIVTLAALAECGTVAGVLDEAPERSLEPVRPDLTVDPEGRVTVRLPDGSQYRLGAR